MLRRWFLDAVRLHARVGYRSARAISGTLHMRSRRRCQSQWHVNIQSAAKSLSSLRVVNLFETEAICGCTGTLRKHHKEVVASVVDGLINVLSGVIQG
ncbi:hypothetical protein PoB_002185800 [Plakobranchus ocellatus]|uniref:Uncharacterized protein n=1 Tax=Plakobranchus ocellatus TaxID=259542 RepID=A0AAV3ZL79_9GAST|nr:hypothetical protein PoB_002185800 [Plakobranchus ocellatus]